MPGLYNEDEVRSFPFADWNKEAKTEGEGKTGRRKEERFSEGHLDLPIYSKKEEILIKYERENNKKGWRKVGYGGERLKRESCERMGYPMLS